MHLLEQARPEFVLAVDPDPASARRCYELGIKVIARLSGPWDNGSPHDVLSPAAYVQECARNLPIPWVWAITTPNEPHPGDAGWLAKVVAGIQSLGVECVVGNWGTGWDGFYVEGARFYASHEYGWPHPWSQHPWHLNRHRSWFPAIVERNPTAKLFISECGVTNAVTGGTDVGFRADGGPTIDEYWSGLLDYADQFPWYVVGAFLFNWAGYPPWETFEHLGTDIEGWMARLWEQTPSESPQNELQGHPEEQNGDADMPQFQLGNKAEAERLAALGIDVGEPLMDEEYDQYGNSYQATSKGEMKYYVKLGLSAFFPKAG